MSTPTKYGPPMKLFNILGASEIRQSRIMVVLIFIIIAAAIIVALITQINQLQGANTRLSDSRVMYGYPNAEGVFVSEKHIPRRHVEGFVSWYLQNYYNFTPDSAEANATEALRIMSFVLSRKPRLKHLLANLLSSKSPKCSPKIRRSQSKKSLGLAISYRSKEPGYARR
jgi:hypothetical protein